MKCLKIDCFEVKFNSTDVSGDDMVNHDFFYRRLFEKSPVGMTIYDASGQCIAANNSICEIIGSTKDQVLAQNFYHIKSWKTSGLTDEACRAIDSGKATHKKCTVKSTFGKKITAKANFVPFSCGDEKYLLLTFDDLTAYQHIEDTLRINEKNLVEAQQIASLGSWSWDIDEDVTVWSDELYRIAGLERNSFLPSYEAYVDRIHPDDRKHYYDFKENIFTEKKAYAIEYRIIRPAGEEIYVVERGEFLFDQDGRPEKMCGTVQDISERHVAERKLNESEQKYRNLFEKMLDGFAVHEIILDDSGEPSDYRFLSVNPAFETMTGLRAEDIVGKTVLTVLPDTEKYWIETYGRVALTGEPVLFENYSAELDKHFEVAAYRPAANQFACIFQDITDRKKADEEKKVLESKLRHAHKMEAIGTLAGGIAHDFNNILSVILGYADMAREEVAGSGHAGEFIGEVIKAGNRAKELVKQILTFSRKEQKAQQMLQPESTVKLIQNWIPEYESRLYIC